MRDISSKSVELYPQHDETRRYPEEDFVRGEFCHGFVLLTSSKRVMHSPRNANEVKY